jgi:signal transduction histidine kinase
MTVATATAGVRPGLELERELHDALGPGLAAAALRIDTALGRVDRDPAAARDALTDARRCVESAIGELRAIVDHATPAPLVRLGLVGAIRAYVAGLDGETGITVVALPLPPLPETVERAAYRIVCEAITNVIRHAGARRCQIALAADCAHLELMVADDGAGILAGATPGVGLSSIRARAATLGGTALIRSGPTGVTVRVRLAL